MKSEIVDFNAWKRYIQICDELIPNSINKTDFEGAEWLSEYFNGYITHPSIQLHSRKICAIRKHCSHIDELKNYFANQQLTRYLYRLTYFPKHLSYFEDKDGTLVRKEHPTPIAEEWVAVFVELPSFGDHFMAKPLPDAYDIANQIRFIWESHVNKFSGQLMAHHGKIPLCVEYGDLCYRITDVAYDPDTGIKLIFDPTIRPG